MMLSPTDEPSRDSIMPARRPPRFTIHRHDSPGDSNYSAFWRVDGHTYWVRVWTDSQWRLLAEPDRALDACRLSAGGWLVVRSIEEPPAAAVALGPFGVAAAVSGLPSPDRGTSAPSPDEIAIAYWSGTFKVVSVLSILSVVFKVIPVVVRWL
jgi:hypothetical protein